MNRTINTLFRCKSIFGICCGIFLLHALPVVGQDADSLMLDSLNMSEGIVPTGDIREPNPIITGQDLVEDDFLGSWPMFGSNLRMKIGGYVKADFIYDFNGTTDRTQFLMSTIPVEGQPEYDQSGYINFFAKETRINVDVRRTGSDKLPLRMFVEGDFFSASNQFRLRHAYMVAGDFIIGQTWTTLSILEALPFIIDFAAGDALFGGRTAQIRYQKDLNDKYELAIGLEMLSTVGIENPNDLVGESSVRLPLLALRLKRTWETGMLVLGTSFAELRWDGGENPNPTAFQYSFLVAGRQYLGKNNNNYVSWNVSVGNGNGENILAFIGSDANAVLASQNSLTTMQSFSLLLGYMHKWNENFSSNLSYAYGWLDTPPSRDPFSLKRGGVGHANLIWQINQHFSTGMEYIWGGQRTSNGAVGYGNRIQMMGKFSF